MITTSGMTYREYIDMLAKLNYVSPSEFGKRYCGSNWNRKNSIAKQSMRGRVNKMTNRKY